MRTLILLLVLTTVVWAKQSEANFEESKVAPYVLPDPLLMASGARVSGLEMWPERRRELLALFSEHIYGAAPTTSVTWSATQKSDTVFSGQVVRTLVDLKLACQGREMTVPLLIYRPLGSGPFPVVLGMNFCGNHTVYPDPGIPLSKGWVSDAKDVGQPGHQATEGSRGGRSMRWPVEAITRRGYAVCTLGYGDIEPDIVEGFGGGVHRLLGVKDGWGAIAAWAWGLSRVADFLEKEPWVARIGVVGHSRLGKAALWAGATDARFGLVISNNSGCGGAALSRRAFGETVEGINTSFPHWFVAKFRDYNGHEADLPVDQHELLSLMAGRCVYVASAEADIWADPEGERLAVEAARPVFELVGGAIGYHRRPGQHNVTPFDWERFLDFADLHWKANQS